METFHLTIEGHSIQRYPDIQRGVSDYKRPMRHELQQLIRPLLRDVKLTPTQYHEPAPAMIELSTSKTSCHRQIAGTREEVAATYEH